MKRKHIILPALLLAAALIPSCTQGEQPVSGVSELTLSLQGETVRTTMGPLSDGVRKVFWSENDRVSLNGTASSPLTGVEPQSAKAVFVFPTAIDAPYRILYPASFYKDGSTITLPASQTFAAGNFATDTYPMAAYAADADAPPIALQSLCALVKLPVVKASGAPAATLKKVTFTGNAGEQVCGDFTIDYPGATLTPAGAGASVSMTVGQALSESQPVEIYLVVPAGNYSKGFSVELQDEAGRTMKKSRSTAVVLTAGSVARMAAFPFVPGSGASEFILQDIIEEFMELDEEIPEHNIRGRVVDTAGNPLQDVVVTDGTQCVQTNRSGHFYMTSELDNVKFVHVSTPSGYLPPVENGIPRFYKAKADITPSGGIYDFGDYVLTNLKNIYSNPDNFTVFFTADPQERSKGATLDNVAYRSHRIREGLIQDLKETAVSYSSRPVIGICLGDIVHENMSLYDWYLGNNKDYPMGLKQLSFPTYHIIGNHDNNPAAADDEAGAANFESYFGPRNYSFNLGGIHFVVLDNLIMKKDGSRLTAYDQGLTDAIWAWLQADMAFVPTTTKVMVCAHSPMFRQENGSERTNTAKHGGSTNTSEGGAFGYGDLFDQYGEVHAWAGHTHSTFNYIYGSSHRHKNIQVHTLARSTGELWTNEYLANGTPRGYTIVNVNNGVVSWKFHPMKYQPSSFHGGNGAPSYTWRDWDYTSDTAFMRDTGAELNEDYQMHVYAPGAYGDNCVYANIFLWDSKWGTPVFIPTGGSAKAMSHVAAYDGSTPNEQCYDKADTEFRTFYVNHYGSTLGSSYTASSPGLHTLFKVQVSGEHGSGTVRVIDRFNKTYTRDISW